MTNEPSIQTVKNYLKKEKDGMTFPNPEYGFLDFDPRKIKVKGSKLDLWRKKGEEGGMCPSCMVSVTRLTVDHIIPLFILEGFDNAFQIAVNDEDNFQYLCEICNRKKSAKLDIRNPRTARLLAKYIAPYLK